MADRSPDASQRDFAANVIDPTVARRANATDIHPRYKPAALRPFRRLLHELIHGDDSPPKA